MTLSSQLRATLEPASFAEFGSVSFKVTVPSVEMDPGGPAGWMTTSMVALPPLMTSPRLQTRTSATGGRQLP